MIIINHNVHTKIFYKDGRIEEIGLAGLPKGTSEVHIGSYQTCPNFLRIMYCNFDECNFFYRYIPMSEIRTVLNEEKPSQWASEIAKLGQR